MYHIIRCGLWRLSSSNPCNLPWRWNADGSYVDWTGRRVGRIMIRMYESSVWIDECVFWMDRWMVFWIDGPRWIDEQFVVWIDERMVWKDRWIGRIFWKDWWIDVRKKCFDELIFWKVRRFDEWIDEWIFGNNRWMDFREGSLNWYFERSMQRMQKAVDRRMDGRMHGGIVSKCSCKDEWGSCWWMRRDNQSEIVCCQNAKLGRVMVFVDENVILKMYLLDPCSGMMIEISRCTSRWFSGDLQSCWLMIRCMSLLLSFDVAVISFISLEHHSTRRVGLHHI